MEARWYRLDSWNGDPTNTNTRPTKRSTSVEDYYTAQRFLELEIRLVDEEFERIRSHLLEAPE